MAITLVAAALVGGIWFLTRSLRSHEASANMGGKPATSTMARAGPAGPETSEMLQMARAALLACGAPAAPTGVPDGRTATREQMVAAQATVKAFDEATTIYVQCVDTAAYQAAIQFRSVATNADTAALNALQVRLHNEAIDRDQGLANRFNGQLRLFKARGQK